MKVLGASLVAATALFLMAVNLSFVDTSFFCAGVISSEDGWHPATTAFTLRRYRWWADLWTASEGHAWIKLPDGSGESFAHVDADRRVELKSSAAWSNLGITKHDANFFA